ncbi:MAG TPA: NADH-quinone oxidoreductase subunit NuoG [bacterium]|nr:NADH-quinone oxidoreductase subunit NuoG [bacterium]
MAKIWVDGKTHDVDGSRNLLDVCLSLGKNLPYFCWHPATGSVGACRQCAVKQYRDENDKQGKLVMACMTQALEGSRISIEDGEARAFRKSVAECLMVNHPHDCPVCDEGGECHLQDMTVMTGHNYRAYRFPKKTYENQDLGPFVNHEMNRCIQCYRCVHYYKDIAGGKDLQAFACHDHVYFGRHQDGTLESEFSGNLVEVCPTGVFTDKTLKKHYTRKWDLQTAPSVCVHCSLGCNTIPGERYGSIRRIRNRYHGKVNGYFLCDRGRYGYEFVNHEQRIRRPLLRNSGGALEEASREAVMERLGVLLSDPKKVVGIGSPRASMESNFALRSLVGPERFFQGIPDREAHLVGTIVKILKDGPARSCSLREIEQCDAVLILGEDVTNTGPMVEISVRAAIKQQPMRVLDALKIPTWHAAAVKDAIQDEKGPLFIATPSGTKLDGVATVTYRGTSDDCARLGFAVAKALDAKSPDVPECPAETRELAASIAEVFRTARRPVVISGTSLRSEAVIHAAANVAWASASARSAGPAELFFVLPECNSMGLALMGGTGIESASQAVVGGAFETAIVLESDLTRHTSAEAIERFAGRVKHLVVVDSILTPEIAARAEVVLPAGTYAEADGTFVNSEGRAQRFYQVFVPETEIQESWRWIHEAGEAAGQRNGWWSNLDDVCTAAASAIPALAALPQAAPPASFRLVGEKVAREPHRYSGRTAMFANRTMHEPKPPSDPDTPLSFSMEGYEGPTPAALTSHFWAPGWNSIQSLNRFQEEISGPLRGGDAGVRLLEPSPGARAPYFDRVPEEFRRKPGEWILLPLHHIFGSEEMSSLSPPIQERAAKPYVQMNSADAAELGLKAGDLANVHIDGVLHRLPVRLTAQLLRGTAGVPVGLARFPVLNVPAWTRITKG